MKENITKEEHIRLGLQMSNMNSTNEILSMYAKGMTTGDIESHMRELYDIDIPDRKISRITDKILPIVKEWQERPLEEVYAVVFMDAIHFNVREDNPRCLVKSVIFTKHIRIFSFPISLYHLTQRQLQEIKLKYLPGKIHFIGIHTSME